MEVQLIMSVIAGASSVLGAIVALLTIRHKSEAEKELLRALMSRASTLREMRNRIMHDGVTTAAELEELVASIESATKGLRAEHRRLIVSGLHQSSVRGRARYVAKLMNKIGIGSGTLPVATP